MDGECELEVGVKENPIIAQGVTGISLEQTGETNLALPTL